jgi:hypothetical protein
MRSRQHGGDNRSKEAIPEVQNKSKFRTPDINLYATYPPLRRTWLSEPDKLDIRTRHQGLPSALGLVHSRSGTSGHNYHTVGRWVALRVNLTEIEFAVAAWQVTEYLPEPYLCCCQAGGRRMCITAEPRCDQNNSSASYRPPA